MSQKPSILFITAELTPIAKVGGLADVAESLPKALTELHENISVLMPYHEIIKKSKINIKPIKEVLSVPFGTKIYPTKIYRGFLPNNATPIYFLENNKFISRGPVYQKNKLKYIFFTQAVAEFIKAEIIPINLLHFNDWHASAAISLLKKENINKLTLLTIHNLAMQGKIKNYYTKFWHPSLYNKKLGEYNCLKQAIINVDYINTVSKQYAKEILTPKFGAQLNALLNKHKNKLIGITNGIDQDYFNPQTDKKIFKNYNYQNLANKYTNKTALQKKCKLAADHKIPIIGLVSRITKQKGIDLIIKSFPTLAKLPVQFIFTGNGDPELEAQLINLQKKYSSKFYYYPFFDEPFGQQIYAGSDIFLMPSRFEPCGLGQMIAMKYGTLPIVHGVGGLKNTVKNNYNGFVFNQFNQKTLINVINKTLLLYHNQSAWHTLIKNAMQTDNSWHVSAIEYLNLYKKLLKKF